MAKQYRRIGEQKKCPACGWRLDAEAYRCPKCFIYFCYKCRARVTKGEPQYQCADQSCECYGKLLCAACTMMVPEVRDVTRTYYEKVPDAPERSVEEGDNLGCVVITVSILLFCVLFWRFLYVTPTVFKALQGAAFAAVMAFFFMKFILTTLVGSTFFKKVRVIPATTKQMPRSVTETKQVAEHRCCIQCKHPIKHVT